ncbi:MAG: hypothetical protein IPN03_21125 [Holophagales bacterium]|nr:hypothetical protein [Holophagales bacterium]
MAPELFIMPLSRYVTGDYVTPAMASAWGRDEVATVVQPGRDLIHRSRGVPLGGETAAIDRRLAREQIEIVLREFTPGLRPEDLWREDSAEPPRFHLVHRSSEIAFRNEMRNALSATTPFRSLLRRLRPRPSHFLSCLVFLPVRLSKPIVLVLEAIGVGKPRNVLGGSLFALRAELSASKPSERSTPARSAWLEATDEAIELKLPLIRHE